MIAPLWLLSTILHTVLPANCNPLVQMPLGKLQGITKTIPTGKTVDAFLGVPYAEAPTGSNRFLPPRMQERWKDAVLVADRFQNSCFEFVTAETEEILYWVASKANMSEDCLYLNIWVPNPRPQNEAAAVMVWIHGGGFSLGSASMDLYDGSVLAAEENVIVVSINYRLNVFGFLKIDGTEVTGNMGLKDQVAALKWIQLNIGYFGGDPRKVTIFGESAGGISCALHLISPMSKNLFSSVIIQSGPPTAMAKFERPSDALTKLIANVKCSTGHTNSDLINCLRQTKPETLISHLSDDMQFAFYMVTDGEFLDNDISLLTLQRRFYEVNVLIGITKDDGSSLSFFLSGLDAPKPNTEKYLPTRSDKLRMVKNMLPFAEDIAHNAVELFYTDWSRPNDSVDIRQQMFDIVTDYIMRCDSNHLADQLSEAGRNVFRYEFSHTSLNCGHSVWMGATHGDEIPFVFGRPLERERGFNDEDVELSKKMMRYWANFAKYGDPNDKADDKLENWPRHTLLNKEYIDLSTEISIKKDNRDRECAFWFHIYPELDRLAKAMKTDGYCHV